MRLNTKRCAWLMGFWALSLLACDRSPKPTTTDKADQVAPAAPSQAEAKGADTATAAVAKKLPVALTWEPGKPIPECALEEADWEQRKNWSKEDRETCWRKQGIWPYAPPLTDGEWAKLDVGMLSLAEVELLRGRAVTGDLCAVLKSDETEPLERWSPVLWVEGNIAIWVVEGQYAYDKAIAVLEATGGAKLAGAGVVSCDGGVVILYITGANAKSSAIATTLLDEGLRISEVTSFAVSSNEELVESCLDGRFWPQRCALLMQRNLVNPERCPSEGTHNSELRDGICRGSRRFLERYSISSRR